MNDLAGRKGTGTQFLTTLTLPQCVAQGTSDKTSLINYFINRLLHARGGDRLSLHDINNASQDSQKNRLD